MHYTVEQCIVHLNKSPNSRINHFTLELIKVHLNKLLLFKQMIVYLNKWLYT